MEYHEIHSFINQDKSRQLFTSTSTTNPTTTDGDSSSLGYSSDDSFDSYDTTLRQVNILEQQTRKYYQLHVSPLPQKKQHWHITPSHPPTEKLESNSSLSKKIVQGVQSLKNKVASFSPSGLSSTSEISLASSFASDEYHSLGPPSSSYGHPYDTTTHVLPPSEISTTNRSNVPLTQSHVQPTIELLSPIPNPNHHTLSSSLSSSDQPQQEQHYHMQMTVADIQQLSVLATTHELLASRTLLSSSASKRSKVRKRLHSIWKKHLFKPTSTPRPTRKSTTTTKRNNHPLLVHKDDITFTGDGQRVTQDSHLGTMALSFKVLPPDRSSHVSSLASSYQLADSGTTTKKTQSRSPSMIMAQVSEHIQKLQCLVDIEVQLVEDHQRDIEFYTNQLEQLNQDVQYLNNKVSMTLSNIENNMVPLQDDIQRTIPLLSQLHTKHQFLVTKFTNDVLRNRSKDTFNIIQSKVKSAEQHLRRWDTITFWTTLISVTLLVCMFLLWLIYSTGMIVTSILVLVLVSLFYDAS